MRNLTLKHLRMVEAIAATGKIASAARALNVTPPAITLQLQQLETTVGMVLFERDRRGLRLTAAGELLRECSRDVESRIAGLVEAVDELRGLRSGRVAIGVVSTAKYFVPSILGAFKQAHPDIELRLFVSNRAELIASLAAMDVDFAVMGRPPETIPLASEVLCDHPLVIIAAPLHRLCNKRKIQIEELVDETMLVREAGSGTRVAMDHFFAGSDMRPRKTMEISSNETIKQAVMAGLGIAVISAHTISAELEANRLVTLDVVGTPLMRQWFVVRHANKHLMPPSLALWGFFLGDGLRFLPTNPPGRRQKRRDGHER
ncbi:MAG: LysR family transcriptional regulator [Hyphomicrobiaceae bacterium]